MKKIILICIAILALLGAFYGGRFYEYLRVPNNQDVQQIRDRQQTQEQDATNSTDSSTNTTESDGTDTMSTSSIDNGTDMTIDIDRLQANDAVRSPLVISGSAPEYWYADGHFFVTIFDAEGHEIGSTQAQAQDGESNNGSTRFVATLRFSLPPSSEGKIVFRRANASPVDDMVGMVELPIQFDKTAEPITIQVESPLPNQLVYSPLLLRGLAVGWYFEGDFPVWIEDENGTILAESYVTAQDDWMAIEYVPFEGSLVFDSNTSERGFVVFQEDNPGKEEGLEEYRIPIRFK